MSLYSRLPGCRNTRQGVTLVELLVVATVIGLLFSLAPKFIINFITHYRLNLAQIEVRRDARLSITEIMRQIRWAKSSTVVVSALPGEPPYSKLTFTNSDNVNVSFYQQGRQLMVQDAAGTRALASTLNQLSFSLPTSNSTAEILVSVSTAKMITKQLTATELLIETARPMN